VARTLTRVSVRGPGFEHGHDPSHRSFGNGSSVEQRRQRPRSRDERRREEDREFRERRNYPPAYDEVVRSSNTTSPETTAARSTTARRRPAATEPDTEEEETPEARRQCLSNSPRSQRIRQRRRDHENDPEVQRSQRQIDRENLFLAPHRRHEYDDGALINPTPEREGRRHITRWDLETALQNVYGTMWSDARWVMENDMALDHWKKDAADRMWELGRENDELRVKVRSFGDVLARMAGQMAELRRRLDDQRQPEGEPQGGDGSQQLEQVRQRVEQLGLSVQLAGEGALQTSEDMNRLAARLQRTRHRLEQMQTEMRELQAGNRVRDRSQISDISDTSNLRTEVHGMQADLQEVTRALEDVAVFTGYLSPARPRPERGQRGGGERHQGAQQPQTWTWHQPQGRPMS